jgi:hypothetical protein
MMVYRTIDGKNPVAGLSMMGARMHAHDDENVVADLINVYTSAADNAHQAALRSLDTRLPIMERLSYRRQATRYQELADQALRMVNELTAKVAA